MLTNNLHLLSTIFVVFTLFSAFLPTQIECDEVKVRVHHDGPSKKKIEYKFCQKNFYGKKVIEKIKIFILCWNLTGHLIKIYI